MRKKTSLTKKTKKITITDILDIKHKDNNNHHSLHQPQATRPQCRPHKQGTQVLAVPLVCVVPLQVTALGQGSVVPLVRWLQC